MGWELIPIIAAPFLSTLLSHDAAGDAASAQQAAASEATQAQLQMYEQSRQDMAPWKSAGQWALNQLIGPPT
ncbi:MAG: hypothetical protein JRI34_07765, partial [Deltaproteobacteria bacterium]|nr:hypothetical protein [Deltaproteobacteria bacterium]